MYMTVPTLDFANRTETHYWIITTGM